MRRTPLLIALVALMSLLPAGAADRGVRVDDNFFDPVFLVVDARTTVVWEHTGSAPHSVTSQPGSPRSFDSNPNCSGLNFLLCMQQGERFAFTFDEPGTYTYYCRVHGQRTVKPDPSAGAQEQPCGMCGIVRVRDRRSSPSPSPTATRIASPSPAETAPTAGPTPSPTVTASPTATASPTPESSPALVAERDRGNGGSRAAIAIVGVLALSAIGYFVWRSLIADR